MTGEGYRTETPEAVQAMLAHGEQLQIVDVRTSDEFRQYHIPGAILMPLQEIVGRARGELAADDQIILVCEHGVRSEAAAQYLASLHFARVSTMAGGMSCYNGPVERGL